MFLPCNTTAWLWGLEETQEVSFFLNIIYGCVGSSFLCKGFLQLWQVGATLHRGARASSLSRPLLLRSSSSRHAGSVIVAHGPSCSAACGIFPDEGSNPCPLHWQADSQPLRHQGSPRKYLIMFKIYHRGVQVYGLKHCL